MTVDRTQIEGVLRSFFAGQTEFACVYLYGSVARGTASEQSDVDLGVLYAAAPERTLESIPIKLADELSRLTGRNVEIVVLNFASSDLVHRVVRDGVLLAENDRSVRVRFEVKRRAEYLDLEPVRRLYRAPRASRSVT